MPVAVNIDSAHKTRERPAIHAFGRFGLGATAIAVAIAIAAPAEAREGDAWRDEIGVAAASDVEQGDGVVIGILGSGVDADHEDLDGAVSDGWSPWALGRDGTVDTTGLGTALAGVAAGRGADGVGVGVAPKARIVSAGIAPNPRFDRDGNVLYRDDLLRSGLRYLADSGADVILAPSLESASARTRHRVATIVEDLGVPIVTPSTYPAAPDLSAALAVTTGGPADARCASNDDASGPVFAAPGGVMRVPVPGGRHTETALGRDGAAAVVTGVVALMKARWPDMPSDVVAWRLARTAVPAADEAADGCPSSDEGARFVDAHAALTASVEPMPDAPEVDVNPPPGPSSDAPEPTRAPAAAPVPVVDEAPWRRAIAPLSVLAAGVAAIAWSRRGKTRTGPPSPDVVRVVDLDDHRTARIESS